MADCPSSLPLSPDASLTTTSLPCSPSTKSFDNPTMEGLTNTLSLASLDSDSSDTDTSTLHGIHGAGTTDSLSDATSVSDITSTTEDYFVDYSGVVPFNDRSKETRDARTAAALCSLDEDIPLDMDDSIKELMKAHHYSLPSALTPMERLVHENKLEHKANLAAKRALENALPRSKAGRSVVRTIKTTETPHFETRFLMGHLKYSSSHKAKQAHQKELLKSKGSH